MSTKYSPFCSLTFPLKQIFLSILITISSTSADLSHSGNVVNDTVTNLQWQDDMAAQTTYTTWKSAIDYCEVLSLDTYDDWRLPNRKELLSIADRSRYSPAIDNTVFLNTIPSHYWSSTTYAYATNYAWFVHFRSGYSYYGSKDYNYYVRCVRGGVEPVVKMPPAVIIYLIN